MTQEKHLLKMVKLSPTMEVGTLAKWHKKVGDKIAIGDKLAEVATDKATVEMEAHDAGYLRAHILLEGEEATVNQPIAIITKTADEPFEAYVEPIIKQEEKKTEEKVSFDTKSESSAPAMKGARFVPEPALENYEPNFITDDLAGRVKATPLARAIAKTKGLDLSKVKGTGPGGRIVREDLALAPKKNIAAFGPKSLPDVAPGSYSEHKMSAMRKVIAERLQMAKTFIPHFYVTMEIDAVPIMTARAQLKELGQNISVNDFVIKAVALSLKENPKVNSGFNSVNETIVSFETIDISVAVAIPDGLITPIVRYADIKNVGQISMEVRALAQHAKEGKLKPEEFKGGSFTVSNLGMYGVEDFIGIINPPQAALLAVGGIIQKPVVKEGSIVIGHTMKCTLSADHRVVDGADGAKFLQSVKKFLENPAALLI